MLQSVLINLLHPIYKKDFSSRLRLKKLGNLLYNALLFFNFGQDFISLGMGLFTPLSCRHLPFIGEKLFVFHYSLLSYYEGDKGVAISPITAPLF